jgi:hypothetical protein
MDRITIPACIKSIVAHPLKPKTRPANPLQGVATCESQKLYGSNSRASDAVSPFPTPTPKTLDPLAAVAAAMLTGGQSYVSAPPVFSADGRLLLICSGRVVSVFSTSTAMLVSPAAVPIQRIGGGLSDRCSTGILGAAAGVGAGGPRGGRHCRGGGGTARGGGRQAREQLLDCGARRDAHLLGLHGGRGLAQGPRRPPRPLHGKRNVLCSISLFDGMS